MRPWSHHEMLPVACDLSRGVRAKRTKRLKRVTKPRVIPTGDVKCRRIARQPPLRVVPRRPEIVTSRVPKPPSVCLIKPGCQARHVEQRKPPVGFRRIAGDLGDLFSDVRGLCSGSWIAAELCCGNHRRPRESVPEQKSAALIDRLR